MELIRFVQPELKPADLTVYGQSVVKGSLTIDTAGNVRGAVIGGIPENLALAVKTAVLSWKFKPTMLDKKHVDVSTDFQTELNKLNSLPE